MQTRSAERTLRDLFHLLEGQGKTDAAAGVWLAADALGLDHKAWHTTSPVTIPAVIEGRRVLRAARA